MQMDKFTPKGQDTLCKYREVCSHSLSGLWEENKVMLFLQPSFGSSCTLFSALGQNFFLMWCPRSVSCLVQKFESVLSEVLYEKFCPGRTCSCRVCINLNCAVDNCTVDIFRSFILYIFVKGQNQQWCRWKNLTFSLILDSNIEKEALMLVQVKQMYCSTMVSIHFWVFHSVLGIQLVLKGRGQGIHPAQFTSPTWHHSLSLLHLVACFWTVGGNCGTWRKPRQTIKTPRRKSLGLTGILTEVLLV